MKKTLLLAAALAAAPFAASAQSISHTYVEGGVSRLDIDTSSDLGGDTQLDGGYLAGSVGFAGSYYVFGSYARGTNNEFGTQIDATEQRLGLGWAMPAGQRAEFDAELSYVRKEIEVDQVGFSSDGDGARVSAGFRGEFNPHLEGWVKANYDDGGDFDGDFSGTLGVQAKINATWGIVGEAEFADDANRYSVGVRASF